MKGLVIPFFLSVKGKDTNLIYQFKIIAKTGGILALEIRVAVGFQEMCKFLIHLLFVEIC
jgi:hypothetical protein